MKQSDTLPCVDPIEKKYYPSFESLKSDAPELPKYWKCTAILHPFSPVQSNTTPEQQESPFFELCTATVVYSEGKGMNALLVGESGNTWLYQITSSGTTVSVNGGTEKTLTDIGWTIPGTNWLENTSGHASYVGTSHLNWMKGPKVDWWKLPAIQVESGKPVPATWMWFDNSTKFPARLMFGIGPEKGPTTGDPNQLALFQMFSFTYFPTFEELTIDPLSTPLNSTSIDGFSFGNTKHYQLFDWNTNFGMTAFMTPVNEKYNPLPTRVLYKWNSDKHYTNSTDRSQNTLMDYSAYNHKRHFSSQVALLTGTPPLGVTPPANSGTGFIINYENGTVQNCSGYADFNFGQEHPNWIKTPGEDGKIHAIVEQNPILSPGHDVTIMSVLFPPSGKNYPDSTYLWTWYSPTDSTGTTSRPVVFMQSQSGVNKGTSLALADYYHYQILEHEIPGCNFTVPPCDFTLSAKTKWMKTGITINPKTSADIQVVGGSWTANPHTNGGQLYSAAGDPQGAIAKPGYAIPGVREGMLVGRVGSTVFPIGMGASTPPNIVGALELCINDDLNQEYGAGYTDNEGSIQVQIVVSNT